MTRSYDPETSNFISLDSNARIYILEKNQFPPDDAKYIGEIKFGEPGVSVTVGHKSINCTYKKVISKAREESRKAGANILKITSEVFPGENSNCYKLTAALYYKHSFTKAEIIDTIGKNRYILPRKEINDIPVIELYAKDSIIIAERFLIKKFDLSSTWNKKSYREFRNQAVDSLRVKDGNILKVHSFEESPNRMRLEIYGVDSTTFYEILPQIKKYDKQHYEQLQNRSGLVKMFKQEDFSNLNPKPERERTFFSIPRDSTTTKNLEVGVYLGSDVILLGLNLHSNFEYNFINTSFTKIGVSNKAGLMLIPIQNYGLFYSAPGIKISVPIKKIWFSATFGQEYIRYIGEDINDRTDVIDKRIDFGMKLYKDEELSIEIYYPLRLDEEVIKWYWGGIVVGANRRF